MTRFLLSTLVLVLLCGTAEVRAADLIDVSILDKDYLVVQVSDGEVIHHEGATGEEIVRNNPELDTSVAVLNGSWTITSAQDPAYSGSGKHPQGCYRKKKLSGHAQLEWSGNDFVYEYTYHHWIYLQLPDSLQQGMSYTLAISSATNIDSSSESFTFDIYSSRSEAVHVNLVGYAPDATHKAADLYHWMGNGGARSYSSFEGNAVSLYDVGSGLSYPVGEVDFWMASGSDVFWYNLTGSDVWSVDFSGFSSPGTYRLVVEGVGCSQDFVIADDIYFEPFEVSVRGYFYMRIGETNPGGLSPPPRTPLYHPGTGSPATKVYLTTMHPWHPDWGTFTSGDSWDAPNAWATYRKAGNPVNPDAWGGHSDAADWDRHLAHVVNIYDMLLPFLMSDGAISDDDLGITESGNSIPDILDEARYEVDFWLRLRDGDGYGHGVTNPNSSNELFQAGPTAIAAWANAVNAAMLGDAFRVAGLTSLANQYRDAAITAYTYANGLADPMLDEGMELDDAFLRGRDLKMTAAAFLYNLTGNQVYENVVNAESVCASGLAALKTSSRNQLYAAAAYLITPRTVHYPTLRSNLKAQVIAEARSEEADLCDDRPSRRATDHPPAYFHTGQFVQRTIIAHAITDDPVDRDYFRRALALEADWGLGRNPLNMIQMTTAFTTLATRRSVPEAYTSGMDDSVTGVHPGHTPYMNLDDWAPGMTMGRPSALYENSYPGNVKTIWPRGEAYFPSRWVWAHNEFTPRQTMRGKMALYGYLYALAGAAPPPYPTLTVTTASVAGGSGTVTSSPAGISCGSDCSEAYANGTPVTLTASAASGSTFAGWSGACYGDDDTCDLSMTMNRSVTATFQPVGLTYVLTVSTSGSGGGTVSSSPPGISCGTDCSEPYLSGTPVTLTAVADGDSVFNGWEGACSGLGSCVVTMSTARSVTATFRSKVVPPVVIYDDALASGWSSWSWRAEINLAGTAPVYSGTRAVNATLQSWGAFSPAMNTGEIVSYGYHAITFCVHGGTGSNKVLSVYTETADGTDSTSVEVTVVANTWNELTVTLDELGNPPAIARVSFYNDTDEALPTLTFDDIQLVPLDTSIFADGFESGDTSEWSRTVP